MTKQEKWREIIERQAVSGLSIRGFCREEKVDEAGFYFWRKRLRDQAHPNSQDFIKVASFPAQNLSEIELRFNDRLILKSSDWPPAEILKTYLDVLA